MTPTCSGGTCGSGTAMTETQACMVDVNGHACTTVGCGQCSTGLFSGCPMGQTGSQTCTTTTGSCAMGLGGSFYCMGSFNVMTQSCTCS
jgi:hypothetical protein